MEAHDGNKMALQMAGVSLGHLRVLTSNTTWRETAQEAGRKVERNVSTAGSGVAVMHTLTHKRWRQSLVSKGFLVCMTSANHNIRQFNWKVTCPLYTSTFTTAKNSSKLEKIRKLG